MREKYTYLSEKFSLLIYGLVVGKGNIKERLIENNFLLHTVFGLSFPPELEDQKLEIIARLEKYKPMYVNEQIVMSSYERTIRKIHKKTAVNLTKNIYSLYCNLQFYCRRFK